MKKIYEFKINKNIKSQKQIEKEIEGKTVLILEDVVEKIPLTYFIRKPTRTERNDAELFESIEFSNLIRKGIITRSEVIKTFTLEDVEIEKTYKSYAEKETQFQRLSLQEKTPELEEKITELQKELIELLVKIQDFELTKSSVFNRTADSMARNKTILWWLLNLAYKIEGDKEIQIFEGKDFSEKLDHYNRLLEGAEDNNDVHFTDVIQRFFYFIPAWYTGQAVKEEDFKKIDNLISLEMRESDKEEIKQTSPEKENTNIEQKSE